MASTKQSSRTSALREVATIGLDLAKTTVHLVGLDATGQMLTRRRYSKGRVLEVTAKMEPCRIGMEASCGSHHIGRELLAQGQDAKLMPPKYVKPFVKRDKNDTKDAEACAEACLRPTMRFVALKSEQQLSMQSVHRHRSRLVGNSTQLVNQARAFLLERGIAVPQGKRKFAERLPDILEDADNGLPDAMREPCSRGCWPEWEGAGGQDRGDQPPAWSGGGEGERRLPAVAARSRASGRRRQRRWWRPSTMGSAFEQGPRLSRPGWG